MAEITIDGLRYEIFKRTKTARVKNVAQGYKSQGSFTILPSVKFEGELLRVTEIGDEAFEECKAVTISIPDTITHIGNWAFHGCSGLTSITIPNSVTSIGKSAFHGCSGLTSITIPNSVTSIGKSAFHGCSGLTSITIPESVTSIGNGAFWGCSGLTSIVVEEGNSTYDSRDNCNAIIETTNNTLIRGYQNTTIPNSVTSIGDRAFSGCSGLTSITIPNSVTSIGEGAFSGCSGLTSITIPNSVTSIGKEAFLGCSGLTSITIPNSVTSIGEEAFSGCSGLTSIVVKEGNSTYDSRDNCNAIIETTNNTLIRGCQNTTIPNSVTSIGSYAFFHCHSLRFITIPKSVTSIGDNAFCSCFNLMSITVLSEDVMIGNKVFEYTQWWENQPDGFVYLGKILLGYKGSRSDVQSAVDIKEGTTSIAAYAFTYCRVPAVNLPKSLKCIGGNAFRDCSRLTSISIPSSMTRIGDNIFSSYYLKTLILTADSIKEYCKSGINEQLEKSYTGSRIIKIKNEEVTEVVIPDTVTSILPYAFARIPSITSVKIPNSVTTIEDSAFKNCKALTSITIPDSVTTIGAYALKDCDTLTSITIPYSVTTIGKGALGGCDKLDTIIIENTPDNITFDFANNSDDQWISKVQFVGRPENVEQLKADMEGMINESPATSPTANRVTHGAWTLELAENKSVKIYKNGELCEKTSPALRELAAEVGFTYDPGWNTRQFGSKLFAHLKN